MGTQLPPKGGTQLPRPGGGHRPAPMDQDATWYEHRPRPMRHCVNGNPAPPTKKGHSPPQFSAHVCCGQTAVRISIPLCTEVDLGLGDIVIDGDPASPPLRGHSPPIFGLCLLWPNGWMITMSLGTGVGLGPGDIVLDGDPAPPRRKVHSSPSLFGSCLLWPRSPI